MTSCDWHLSAGRLSTCSNNGCGFDTGLFDFCRLLGRPAMLYFVFNAGVIAVLVAHDLTQGTFVAQVSA
jgi:hypothetical protein